MSFVGVSVNGEEVPFKGMQLSFSANPKYIEAFYRLFSGTGKMNYNTGNDILREEFTGGNAIYCFDQTPDICGSAHRQPGQCGYVILHNNNYINIPRLTAL